MPIEHKARIDLWLLLLLTLPLVLGITTTAAGVVSGVDGYIWKGIAELVIYLAILILLVLPMRYWIDGKGVHIRAGKLIRADIPLDRIIGASRTSNPLSGPALSLRRIALRYEKPSGRRATVLIAPADRDGFMRDIAETSRRHRFADGKLVRT